jgi:N-acyl homoserine lactone hydrolase
MRVKRFLLLLLLVVVAGVGGLAATMTAATLPAGAPIEFATPSAQPPEGMKIAAIDAGKMFSQAAFAYRGGSIAEERVFGMGSILVQHPHGTLLFDTGFGRDVDAHFQTVPALMRATSKYEKESTVADQLKAAGIDPATLKGIVLTHAHWDHVSGIPDLDGAPVWVTQPELDFILGTHPMTQLLRSFAGVDYQVFGFLGGPYLGFPQSHDVFGDGSVVMVPAPGHTPGSIIAFITLPGPKRYALVGDLVWQVEGIQIPAERPWLSRRLVDFEEDKVRGVIGHMHQLHRAMPDLVIVPSHDRRVWERLPRLGQ